MAQLISIPGIGKSSLELLETAGFHDVEALAKANVADVVRDLERANTTLRITKRTPGSAVISKWIAMARELVEVPESQPAPAAPPPVDYEHTPQVAAMLGHAPFAIPLPARTLIDHQLGVADIPPAILLNRYAGDLDVKGEANPQSNQQPRQPHASIHYVRISDHAGPRVEIDTSKMRSTENLGDAPVRVAAVKSSPSTDRVALIRAPLETTNKGRSPQSRWYIRGVLHAHPVSIYLGALVTLVIMIMTPVAIVSAGLLLLSGEIPEKFSWVPAWFLVFPLVLPVLGFFYLVWGLGGTCRICGQKLFAHRPHLKNSRAHHVTCLGYILPLCVHVLLFRWFRCTHCGTPVRLKK